MSSTYEVAGGEGGDLALVGVEADDVEAGIDGPHGDRQADVALPHHDGGTQRRSHAVSVGAKGSRINPSVRPSPKRRRAPGGTDRRS